MLAKEREKKAEGSTGDEDEDGEAVERRQVWEGTEADAGQLDAASGGMELGVPSLVHVVLPLAMHAVHEAKRSAETPRESAAGAAARRPHTSSNNQSI